MVLRTALCLAFALAAPAAKPRPRPAPALKADPSVPAPGASGERVDPRTGRGRAVGPFLTARTDFQATALPGGRVLVTGGSLASPTSEWFDPARDRFSPGPALLRARQGHRALLLKDGRLLLLGGTEAPSPAEVLDPGAAAFREVPEARFGFSADAVELDEGRVLMVDGASGALYLWDGKRVSAKGTLARPRIFFRALRLKDGRVAVTGGWPSDARPRGRRPAPNSPSLPVECFNPRWSTLSSWSALPAPRARHQATLLPDGRIALWGGVGQDGDTAVAFEEILDPVKETVTRAGALDLGGHPAPGWAAAPGGWRFLAEGAHALLAPADPAAPLAGEAQGRLANGYLGPTLVPLPDGGTLVLGTCAFGDPVERWDPRTRACTVVGTLRDGAEGLGQLPDGTVLSLGPVVDRLDPRTGALTPLGWREDLPTLLKAVKGPEDRPLPALPAPRPGAVVVPLDRTHALVAGGTADGEPSGAVEFWDLKRKTLTPAGALKARRAAPHALKLSDGSVLLWGPGRE